jgi:spermidine/putrescine-binding protein
MTNLRIRPFRAAGLGLAAAGLILGLSACAKPAKEPAVLHVYTWADYIKPELVARFEAENACQVVIDTFDSNEAMYAKIKAGATGYDLITPTSYMVSLMQSQGLLQPLDKAKIPNAGRIDPEYLAIAVDRTMDHSVPYMITNTGIAYLKSKVKDFEPSWAMFNRADLKGRMVMLNDMRETIGGALKFLGYSLNTRNEEGLEEESGQVRERAVQVGPRLGRVPARPRLQRGHPAGSVRERRRALRHAPRRGHDLLRRPGHSQGGQGRGPGPRLHQFPA